MFTFSLPGAQIAIFIAKHCFMLRHLIQNTEHLSETGMADLSIFILQIKKLRLRTFS